MIYPPADIERGIEKQASIACARIARVEEGSPADDAGFEPGCAITAIDGQPVRDVIDWQWLTAGDEIAVSYIDLDGEEGTVDLWRDEGESWGFGFDDLVFDTVLQCRNACTFCFMHQLPRGMRPSLSVRDDDFRLSFLAGTFVTLTNVTAEDEARILEQRISPLRVSLQAISPDVRKRLIGKHAAHGIDVLERLLDGGIAFHAQIVLVPGENDAFELEKTLTWAYEHPGILTVGIVPLGYTKHQTRFMRSFDAPEDALAVLREIEPFQERALTERGYAWVYAADEFYCNAFGDDVLAHIPDNDFYGEFDMFEDGIGMVRLFADEWSEAYNDGMITACADALRARGEKAVFIAGTAQRSFLGKLVSQACIDDVFEPLYVENEFFGGNVDVTGLLVGEDIARAIEIHAAGTKAQHAIYALPRVVLNDDGLFLDDMALATLIERVDARVCVVSCSPLEMFSQLMR